MDVQVLIADSALADLKEIVEFVAEDNPEAARALGGKLVERALSLATMPERFPLHDKVRGIRRMPYKLFRSCVRSLRKVVSELLYPSLVRRTCPVRSITTSPG